MEYLYIDESGSITNQNKESYFVICIIRVFDKEKIKKVLKRRL
jgi:putative IMPACT (imprinted ancient) family translation regulator